MDINETPVTEMSYEDLVEEYKELRDPAVFRRVESDAEQERVYERRLEIWQHLCELADVEQPECPSCGARSWSQNAGDPKRCNPCGFHPVDTDLCNEINNAWDEILTPS